MTKKCDKFLLLLKLKNSIFLKLKTQTIFTSYCYSLCCRRVILYRTRLDCDTIVIVLASREAFILKELNRYNQAG